MGGGPHFFLVGILIFLLVRRPRNILEPYDNPFWEKSLWWVVVVCKPILVFSFDFSQAEQFALICLKGGALICFIDFFRILFLYFIL